MAPFQSRVGGSEQLHDATEGPQPASSTDTASTLSTSKSETADKRKLNVSLHAYRHLKHAKNAVRKIVHRARPHPFADDQRPPLNHVRHNAAFNPSRVENEYTRLHGKAASVGDRSRAILEDVVDFVNHPKKTVQQKIKQTATARLVSTNHPYVSKTNEYRYLNAQLLPSSLEDSSSTLTEKKQDPESFLENRRDSLLTAWTTAHLRRVHVVNRASRPFPRGVNYYGKHLQQPKPSFQWLRWMGHFLLYLTQDIYPRYTDQFNELPYDILTTRTHVERIVLNSGHWQAWLMDVRSIYRWEDRQRTGRWLLIYSVLWYLSLIPAFFWLYVVYHVLTNRFKKRSIRDIQAAANRALDRESTAFQLGELLDKHGQDEWIDQIVRELGPFVQLQLGDLANFLEVMHNFYRWKSPRKTWWTLCFFVSCMLCCLFADTEFCMKIVFFTAGCSFFFCWPIASRYPQYRLLVSPLKWVFWGIPTDAELSFEYLQREARKCWEDNIKERLEAPGPGPREQVPLSADKGGYPTPNSSHGIGSEYDELESVSDSSDNNEDWYSILSNKSMFVENIVSFRAQWEGSGGRLFLNSQGIGFRQSRKHEESWYIPFHELQEVWKSGLEGHRKPTLRGLFDSGVLAIKDRTGRVRIIDPIKHRDEAFNCIIGFSNLPWQVIPTEPGQGRKTMEEKESNRKFLD